MDKSGDATTKAYDRKGSSEVVMFTAIIIIILPRAYSEVELDSFCPALMSNTYM
jgi:hypothetical protein